ncbi:MAG: hypothetical protein FWH26_05895 [Oscillospiraceae bacterium]|nr:hypothetical protein [Oscillospiraceae bacterium]
MKKAKLGRRAMALLLAAFLSLGIVPVVSAGAAEARTAASAQELRAWQMEKGTARGVLQGESDKVQAIPGPGVLRYEIKTPPTNDSYLLGFENPDLKDLVVQVEMGGIQIEAKWNERTGYGYNGSVEYYWGLSLDMSALPETPGPVEVPVLFSGETYGYINGYWEYKTYSTTIKVPFQALSLIDDMSSDIPLELDEPKTASLVLDDSAFCPNFFSFTPEDSGYYILSASGFPSNTAPFGVAMDGDGVLLGKSSEDLKANPLISYMEADTTYYYAVDYIYFNEPLEAYELTLLVKAYTPAVLTLGQAVQVNINSQMLDSLLSFTPMEAGYYCFSSSSANMDPVATLLDGQMKQIAYNDDGSTLYLTPSSYYFVRYGLDFKLVYQLEANRTYFLSVGSYGGDYWYNYGVTDAGCSVTVEKAYLRSAAAPLSVDYTSAIPFEALFESNYDEIEITMNANILQYRRVFSPSFYYEYIWILGYPIQIPRFSLFYNDYVAVERGTFPVTAKAVGEYTDDGEPVYAAQAAAQINVSYNWWQTFLVVFALGWLWL